MQRSVDYVRTLTAQARSARANRHLGFALAGVAGAMNAGGFLAVHKYTSHMTGVVSSAADSLALGAGDLVLDALGAIVSFLLGAASTALLVNYGRRRKLTSEYALPLMFEAVLLLAFGVLGARLSSVRGLFVPATVMLLCFTMGLQNALITKISRAEIRTTHVTGIVTDLGIELGRALSGANVSATKLRLLGGLLLAFATGGFVGALAFQAVGYAATLPLAIFLTLLGAVPALDDLDRLRARLGD